MKDLDLYAAAVRSDTPFRARMRFHQSWYRQHVLGLPPGVGPGGEPLGSMLAASDGEKGLNFYPGATFSAVQERLEDSRGTIEPVRLRCNLLSSQPMCFNLFAPLASDLNLATKVFSGLAGLPSDLTVTGVYIEYAPHKHDLMNDRTAFDAFVEFSSPQGEGFVGIETKLTEPFSQADYSAGHEGYARWLQHSDSWWLNNAHARFSTRSFNQLWRNHMLAFAMLNKSGSDYVQGFCAVVSHPDDNECSRALGDYRLNLTPEGSSTLMQWSLADIHARVQEVTSDRLHLDWLSLFRLRYLDLQASQPAWEMP